MLGTYYVCSYFVIKAFITGRCTGANDVVKQDVWKRFLLA